MNIELEQNPNITKIKAEVKVSDIISMLREAFLPVDFSKVEEILVSREKSKSEEVLHWKREYELMEKKHGEATTGLIFLKEQLSKSDCNLGELADQVARLEEDRLLDHQMEISVAKEKRMVEKDIERLKRENELQEKKLGEEMKARLLIDENLCICKRELGGLTDRVAWLEEEKKLFLEKIKVSDERENKAREAYKKLMEDFEAEKRKNRDLLVRNTESELARVKAERELESCKKKNEDNDLRVTWLEEQLQSMVNQIMQKSKVEGGKDSKNVTSVLEAPAETKSANPFEPRDGKEKRSSALGANRVNKVVNWLKEADAGFVICPCDEVVCIPNKTVVEKGESSQREKRQKIDTADRKIESAVIEISDSDSDREMPTQNPSATVPNMNVLNVNRNKEEANTVTSEQVAGRNQSSLDSKKNRMPFSDWSSFSIDSDPDSDSESCGSVAMDRITAMR